MKELIKNSIHDPFIFQNGSEITGRGLGPISFFGLEMTQNQNAVIVWDTFFKYLHHLNETPARIIELGTGNGGLSVLMHIYCRSVGAEFFTYDLPFDRGEWNLQYGRLFEDLKINYVRADIKKPEVLVEIAEMIESEGTTILLCDADKIPEWNSLSPHLKAGDYIAAHDYAPNEEFFWEHMAMRVWSFMHIKDEDIKESCEKHHLESVLPDMFLTAGWVVKKRTP